MSIAAEFEVIDETNLVEAPKRRATRTKGPAEENPSEDADASELAAIMQQAAQDAAKAGFELALNGAQDMASKIIADLSAKSFPLGEKLKELEDRIRDAESIKQKTKVVGIKLNELPAKKLKLSPCKVLPMLIAQAKVGQAGGNWPMLKGPTGCGKTVAGEQLAETLELPFDHVNCTEGMSETWIHGRNTPNGFIPGGFFKSYRDGGVFLLDEIDACNENVLLGINTALANGRYHNPMNGETVARHPNFICIGAANTNGKGGTGAYTGRSRLDGATLNRFSLLVVEYNTDLERELCPDKKLLEILWTIRVKLMDKKSQDVISTRDIKNAYLQSQVGISQKEILGMLQERMDTANHSLFTEVGK